MNAKNMLKQLYWTTLLCLGFPQASHSQLTLALVSEREYYADLPIFIQYVVQNEGTGNLLVNSPKQGSPWITPVDVLTSTNQPIEPALISRVSYSPRVNLVAGQSMTGRIDIARFFTRPTGSTGLEPGEYSFALAYQFGTNIADNVKSAPVEISVLEPEVSMRQAVEWLQRVRGRPLTETNSLPAEVLSKINTDRNPYWLATRVQYARWLTRAGRYEDALSVWQTLLEKGNTALTDVIEIRLEAARCYDGLGLPEKADEQLESLTSISEGAFGRMHFRENLEQTLGDPTH